MALRVFQFVATIPAGTTKAAPVTIPLTLDNWDIELLDLEVPAGPAGLMGFYVANNGVQWIPQSPGQFLVWDDVQQSWPFYDQPNASGWQIVGYNLGFFPHAVTVRFHVNPPAVDATPPAPPVVTFVTSNVAELPVVTL